MAITLTELQQKIMLLDEISVLEILEITSEDIAQRFIDRIEMKYDQLVTEFEEFEPDDTSWDLLDAQEEFYTADDYD